MSVIEKLKQEAEEARQEAIEYLSNEINHKVAANVADALIRATIAQIALQAAEKEAEAHKNDPVQQFSQACAKEPRLEQAFIGAMFSVRDKFGTDLAPIADDGWIKWEGGECPVDNRKVEIEVQYRCGEKAKDIGADDWRWSHIDSTLDIIAYRIIQPAADRVEES